VEVAEALVITPFIEREARRMCFVHSGWQPDTLVADVAGLPDGPFGKPVLQFCRQIPAWHLYVPLVRMVLEGLRQPTDDMMDAGVCCRQMAEAALGEGR
jgi:hypothetical protein